MCDVTRILSQIELGDPSAAEQLLPLVYDELRQLAASRLAAEKAGQTLQATALVHEAYLRLVKGQQLESDASRAPATGTPARWNSRGHFFGAAAEAMRRILIDLARHKQTARQGGGRQRCELSEVDRVSLPISDELLDLDEALTRFQAVDPQAAELVKLRIFAGLTVEEAAAALEISPRTAKRHWAYARAWLGRELGGGGLESD